MKRYEIKPATKGKILKRTVIYCGLPNDLTEDEMYEAAREALFISQLSAYKVKTKFPKSVSLKTIEDFNKAIKEEISKEEAKECARFDSSEEKCKQED